MNDSILATNEQPSAVRKKHSHSTVVIAVIISAAAILIATTCLVLLLVFLPTDNRKELINKYNQAWSEYEKANQVFEQSTMKELSQIDPESATAKPYRKRIYYRNCFDETSIFDKQYSAQDNKPIVNFEELSESSIFDQIVALNNTTEELTKLSAKIGQCNASFKQTRLRIDEEITNRFGNLYNDYRTEKDKQTQALSSKYFNAFKKYLSFVTPYEDAHNLGIKDLIIGDGHKIGYHYGGDAWSYDEADTDYAAYYIGWLTNGKVFDSSFDDYTNPTKLIAPLSGSPSMIDGWLKGIEGMHIGGVRIITVPPALGYGDIEQGNITANSTLKFVVMLIKKPSPIIISDELEDLAYDTMGVSLRKSQF
ncbi:FKBP-type peptidyl-prolyl cis-trans isomerase [Candidatus Saccharibacteria bacterium]|nr:FKBP-type peptidyl-prolyl cis-trans isomerase [Candidatus Saccharibacteria bacterium]